MKTLLFLLTILTSITSHAASVTLAWDANPEPELSGYKVYWGMAPRGYTTNTVVATNLTTTVSNLPSGKYYFAVTAVNTNGIESDFSNEVSYGVNPPKNLRITASIQTASALEGPWKELAATSVPIVQTNEQYFRTVLNLSDQKP